MFIPSERGHRVPATFVRTIKKPWFRPSGVVEVRVVAEFQLQNNTLSFDLQAVTDILVTSHESEFGIHTVDGDVRLSINQLMMDLDSVTRLLKEWHAVRQMATTA